MDSNMKKTLWNLAGTAGLLLALVSAANMFIGQFMTTAELSPASANLIGLILWAAETGGCIYLMRLYMLKFAAACPDASNSDTFRMGMATAFLSAFAYSAAVFANMTFISADFYAAAYEEMMLQMGPLMNSESMEMMDRVIPDMPKFTFVWNMIYCFIFGTIVSAVLSRHIPSRNPFAGQEPDQQ